MFVKIRFIRQNTIEMQIALASIVKEYYDFQRPFCGIFILKPEKGLFFELKTPNATHFTTLGPK